MPLLIALSITQVVHEAGHAVCGALHSLQPLRMGLLLFYPAIPGAFVVLPEESVLTAGTSPEEEYDSDDSTDHHARQIPIQQRLRIVSAGVWHNYLTIAFLGILILLGGPRILQNALWTDCGGMRVFRVDPVGCKLKYVMNTNEGLVIPLKHPFTSWISCDQTR